MSTTPAAVRIPTPPRAKGSAEAQAQGVGISSTRSAPPRRAMAARAHLPVRAHSPRWTQWLLMAQTTAQSGPRARRVWAMCQACPRWKGLYSAIMPAMRMDAASLKKRKSFEK